MALAAAAPASANISGSCFNNNTCFWYAANFGGARAAFDTGYEPDLNNYYFPGPGAGGGTPVGNNSASARNTYSNRTLSIYYYADAGGPRDVLSPRSGRNLGVTANNNRSFRPSSPLARSHRLRAALPLRVMLLAGGAAVVAASSGCTASTADRARGNAQTTGSAPAGATAAGAGSGRPPAAPSAPVGSLPPPGRFASYAGSPLPLDAYRTSPADSRAISIAATRVINRCRSTFGFPPTLQPYLALASDDQFARRYSLVRDVDVARRSGYHEQQPAQSRTPLQVRMSAAEKLVTYRAPDGSYDPRADPHQQVAGRPVPAGGCTGEGDRAVGREKEAFDSKTQVAEPLQIEVFERARQDPRVRQVTARWAACMQQQGYQVADPLQAAGTFLQDPQPSPREIRAAVADATCATSVKLYDVNLMVEVEYQKKAIQDNLERLRTARSVLDDQLRKAAAISSAPSS